MPTFITRDYAVSRKRDYPPSQEPYYASLIGSLESDPTDDDAGMLQKRAGKLSKLRVYAEIGGGNGEGSVTLMRKESGGDWEPMSLTVTVPQSYSGGLREDNTHSVTFSADDELCWKIVSNGTTGQFMALRYIVARVEDQ